VDILLWDGSHMYSHKVPSARQPDVLASRVLDGVGEVLSLAPDAPPVTVLAHGTTVATTALIERKGARVGLLTTRGFRDVLEIGRQTRKDHFNIFVQKVPTLVERRLRLELDERIDADGHVVVPLRRDDVLAATAKLLQEGVEAIAVALLNSYRNPAHERQAAAWILEEYPALTTSESADVSAEYGEFERTTTVVLNEYLRPRIVSYFGAMREGFADMNVSAPLRVMQSNGGRLPSETAERYPVRLLRSGPAAGVSGVAQAMRHIADRLITFDMGGTSTDVSIVIDGRAHYRNEADTDGYPTRVVMSDIRSIGAGGGSLLRVDSTGSMHVGPQSAGAEPGPMCYGLNGDVPTMTDASVVLGYINPRRFCGGAKPLDSALATRGMQDLVGGRNEVAAVQAALGAAEIAVTNMAGAVRTLATEHGVDVRDFSLVAFGGAGPLYAALVADELEMEDVLVPQLPGMLCAFGLLVSEFRGDAWRTYPRLLSDVTAEELAGQFAELIEEAARLLDHDDPATLRIDRRVEMCYRGQRHEIAVSLQEGAIQESTIGWLATALNKLFAERYGFAPTDGQPQIVTLRVFASEDMSDQRELVRSVAEQAELGEPAPDEIRLAYFPSLREGAEVQVRDRYAVKPGMALPGPLIIEEDYSTIVVPPTRSVIRLADGALRLSLNRNIDSEVAQ
jgi:N-methylhydantoinase A